MTELNIVLDTSLKPTLPSDLGQLKNQLDLDRGAPSNYYSQYEQTNALLVKNQTDHHLVNGFLHAYNNHLPIKLRADDIQLIIQSVLATCVNNNAEKFRSLFVDHAGKMKLSVECEIFDPNFFCSAFATLMKSNVKDPDFVDRFASNYSTTTPLIATVSNMMLMNTLKEYFSFEMILGCGIPNVILCGSQDDWKKLMENYNYFKGFFKGTELDLWFRHFDTIMQLFLDMRMLADGGSVQAPDHIKELWKRVISHVPQGSGGQTILGGWVRLLVPYTSDNHLIGGLDKKVQCLDLNLPDPRASGKNVSYALQDELKAFYIASGWSTVPKSIVLTPAVLIDYDETEYQVEFASGFYEAAFDNGCVRMNIGYKMTENTSIKTEAAKAKYIERGVESDHGYLRIPRALRFEVQEIKKAFDAHGWSYYGKDPKEEEDKKKYLDQGVEIGSRHNRYKFRIPIALKEQEADIRKVFEIEEYVKIEFY